MPQTAQAEIDALAAKQEQKANAFAEARRKRNLIDIGGGAVVFGGTLLLMVAIPSNASELVLFLLSCGIGAAAGAATAALRGGYGIPLWVTAAFLDWMLITGGGGIFRFLIVACLGAGIALTRRMDRFEGL